MTETVIDDPEKKNSPKELMAFFGTPERPVTIPEFKTFWGSLSEEEKVFYRTVDLS